MNTFEVPMSGISDRHQDGGRYNASLSLSSQLSRRSFISTTGLDTVNRKKTYRPLSKCVVTILTILLFVVVLSSLLNYYYKQPLWAYVVKELSTNAVNTNSEYRQHHSKSPYFVADDINALLHKMLLIQPINRTYLQILLHQINTTRSDIYNYWDVSNYPYFLTLMDIPHRSWDIQKAKFIKLVMEHDDGSGMMNSDDFIVGFSGSSVTAGHGNYDYYSKYCT